MESSRSIAIQSGENKDGYKTFSLQIIFIAYLSALISSIIVGLQLKAFLANPIIITLFATIVGTLVIFVFSMTFRNISIYDPYWSIQPVFISGYWILLGFSTANIIRQLIIFGCILFWSIRLTSNWIKGWTGLNHEDWRYEKYREEYPKLFPLIAFVGLELMPTILVFIGCLTIYPALVLSSRTINILDLFAILITITGTIIEYISDEQMREFRKNSTKDTSIMNKGLWAYSRHPNYFGEITFWFGMFLFTMASDISWWWTIIGPVLMILLFVFISIPLMENYLESRKESYSKYKRNVSMLIPWKT